MSDWVRPFLLSPEDWVSWRDDGKQLENALSDYIGLSAVFHLESVRTPILLAAGEDDGDFLLDAVEMYNRLRRLGKQVVLVRYPDQGHGLSGAALKDFWDREMAFFGRYLGAH
jgi:dipeptidyl aminopeptidase/acylaminoacyl peptidase